MKKGLCSLLISAFIIGLVPMHQTNAEVHPIGLTSLSSLVEEIDLSTLKKKEVTFNEAFFNTASKKEVKDFVKTIEKEMTIEPSSQATISKENEDNIVDTKNESNELINDSSDTIIDNSIIEIEKTEDTIPVIEEQVDDLIEKEIEEDITLNEKVDNSIHDVNKETTNPTLDDNKIDEGTTTNEQSNSLIDNVHDETIDSTLIESEVTKDETATDIDTIPCNEGIESENTTIEKNALETREEINVDPIEPEVVDITDKLNALMLKNEKILKNVLNKHGYLIASFYYYFKVTDKGDWDIKRTNEWKFDNDKIYVYEGKVMRMDDPGNIHFGYLGAVLFPEEFVCFGAGMNNVSKFGLRDGNCKSYYDDPQDQEMMRWGYRLYVEGTLKK